MARGMIVNIDHMGVRAAQAVLDLTEEAGYRGITSAHTCSNREILGRIAQGGGFVAGYALSASDASADQIGFLYGLCADCVTDMLDTAGAEAADREAELMRGAESYVQMWEEAREWQS